MAEAKQTSKPWFRVGVRSRGYATKMFMVQAESLEKLQELIEEGDMWEDQPGIPSFPIEQEFEYETEETLEVTAYEQEPEDEVRKWTHPLAQLRRGIDDAVRDCNSISYSQTVSGEDIAVAVHVGAMLETLRSFCELPSSPAPEPPRTPEMLDFLCSVLVTAVEGGKLTYWGEVQEYAHFEDAETHLLRSTVCKIREEESQELDVDPAPWHEMGPDEIEHGIKVLLTPGFEVNGAIRHSIEDAIHESDAGAIDTEGADAIVQAHLFGQLRYG